MLSLTWRSHCSLVHREALLWGGADRGILVRVGCVGIDVVGDRSVVAEVRILNSAVDVGDEGHKLIRIGSSTMLCLMASLTTFFLSRRRGRTVSLGPVISSPVKNVESENAVMRAVIKSSELPAKNKMGMVLGFYKDGAARAGFSVRTRGNILSKNSGGGVSGWMFLVAASPVGDSRNGSMRFQHRDYDSGSDR